MKLLVCGSRNMDWKHQTFVFNIIRGLDPRPDLLIQGGAPGADSIARIMAIFLGIKTETFKADWARFGKRAGPLRNQQMLDQNPDLVIAFRPTTGWTTGTKDMVDRATKRGIEVRVYEY